MSDYIRREDATREVHNYFREKMNELPIIKTDDGAVFANAKEVDEKCLIPNKEICEAIKKIPPADVREVVHGENIGTDYAECDQFICSECGIHLQGWVRIDDDDYDDGIVHEYEFRFCPNCGARMFAKDTNVPNKEQTMGIYIKGMKMPKDDETIKFVKLLNSKMVAVTSPTKSVGDIHEVIEVKEPHGRLIDAGELLQNQWLE